MKSQTHKLPESPPQPYVLFSWSLQNCQYPLTPQTLFTVWLALNLYLVAGLNRPLTSTEVNKKIVCIVMLYLMND